MTTRCALLAWVALPLGLVSVSSLEADGAKQSASRKDNALDALLLESLDDDLLQGLDDLQREQPNPAVETPPRETPRGDLPDLDQLLPNGLGAGEDIGQQAVSPLETIGRRMRVVQELMGERITSEETQQIQDAIVTDLELMIQQLQAQCKQGQSKAGQAEPKPDANSKPGGTGQGGSGENRGANQPARDSNNRMGAAQADSAELARMKQMIKRVWGHLPAKVRDQMQSGTIEEFLPEYQTLIEAYYSRLAEDEN